MQHMSKVAIDTLILLCIIRKNESGTVLQERIHSMTHRTKGKGR